MNVTRENVNELNAILKIKIEEKDYQSKVENVLKDYRKKANIPGFRPGMIPVGMVKRMYGNAILVDEINKLVSESIFSYIREEKLDVLGEPLPNENQKQIDFDTQKDFEFLFDIALVPVFELSFGKNDVINYYDIKADDEMVGKYMDSYLRRYGKYEKTESVSEKDLVRGNFIQLNADGAEVEDGIKPENVLLSLDIVKDEKILKLFDGKKVDETVKFNPAKAFPNDTELSAMLKIKKEEVAAADTDFNFTITEIQKFIQAEPNQELFDKIFGENVVKNMDEFREKVILDIKSNMVFESEYKFLMDAREKIIEKANIDLPSEFLKRWLRATNKNELTNEQIEKDFPLFEKDLKWQIIKEKIIKENELKVTEEDILDHAKKIATMQFKQYGINFLPEEHLDNYAKELLKKEDDRRKYYEKKFEDKVIDYIKEQVKVDVKEVTNEEFNKLFEN
ncbi:MAG: trigger factor [Bacteroidetes bacterium GWF2_38_335]|nr:MAG: trigger factor [Bacteroidetes bacterium GWF2_38_335]OFY79457.1 MAG: trigger factor [Bacteroidetes bacterium RIFOXYA12_FULL_38_20]HBS86607.1 trigger factor [Bacteroidales bacterium]